MWRWSHNRPNLLAACIQAEPAGTLCPCCSARPNRLPYNTQPQDTSAGRRDGTPGCAPAWPARAWARARSRAASAPSPAARSCCRPAGAARWAARTRASCRSPSCARTRALLCLYTPNPVRSKSGSMLPGIAPAGTARAPRVCRVTHTNSHPLARPPRAPAALSARQIPGAADVQHAGSHLQHSLGITTLHILQVYPHQHRRAGRATSATRPPRRTRTQRSRQAAHRARPTRSAPSSTERSVCAWMGNSAPMPLPRSRSLMPSASGKLSSASGSSAGASFAAPARRDKALVQQRQSVLCRTHALQLWAAVVQRLIAGVAAALAGAGRARCPGSEGEAAARTRAFGRRRRRGGRRELQPALHAGRAVGCGRRRHLLLRLLGLARRGGRAVCGGPGVLRLALLLLHLVLVLLLSAGLLGPLGLLRLLDRRGIGLRGRSLLRLFSGLLVHRDARHSPALHEPGLSIHCRDQSAGSSVTRLLSVVPAGSSRELVHCATLAHTEVKVGNQAQEPPPHQVQPSEAACQPAELQCRRGRSGAWMPRVLRAGAALRTPARSVLRWQLRRRHSTSGARRCGAAGAGWRPRGPWRLRRLSSTSAAPTSAATVRATAGGRRVLK